MSSLWDSYQSDLIKVTCDFCSEDTDLFHLDDEIFCTECLKKTHTEQMTTYNEHIQELNQ